MLVRLLGPVDVTDDEGIVRHSGSALRRAPLAWLALRGGRVRGARLAARAPVGGDAPDSGLRASRFHVSQLRREIGASCAASRRRPGGHLPPGAAGGPVDVLRVRGPARANRRPASPAMSGRPASCAAALSLWRGEPIPLTGPRLRDIGSTKPFGSRTSRRRRRGGIRPSARAAGAGGEPDRLDLLQLVAERPLREAWWSALIVAQHRAGQQAEALRTHQRLRSTRAETLGL